MSKKPTLKDVTCEAFVTTATVSRMLQGWKFVVKHAPRQEEKEIHIKGYWLK